MQAAIPGPNRTRLLSMSFFLFVALATAVVWVLMRPYGTAYFFTVHFLVGLGGPFLLFSLVPSRGWFRVGMVATAAALVALNGWGHAMEGAAPRGLDWSQGFAGVLGLALAAGIQRVYLKAVPRHGATPRK